MTHAIVVLLIKIWKRYGDNKKAQDILASRLVKLIKFNKPSFIFIEEKIIEEDFKNLINAYNADAHANSKKIVCRRDPKVLQEKHIIKTIMII